MNIIDALKDKKLLGQFLENPESWKAWFCFLRAFFALPPEEGDMKLFTKCTGRTEWPTEAAREAWLVVGTRGGKSFVTGLLSVFLAAFNEYKLSPGERGLVLTVAPTKRQAGIIHGYASSFLNENSFLAPQVEKETSDQINITNQTGVATLSSDFRSLRGFTGIAAIVDEIAYMSLEGSKPDIEIIRALRSRLTTTGGPLIAISSPYAKRGTLYDTHKKHFGKNGDRILVWQASSLTMNPTLDADVIQIAKDEDPAGGRADYDAEFRNDIESYATRETVEGCVISGRHELAPVENLRYRAFADPSGGSSDSFTLCIGHEKQNAFVVDCLREWEAPFVPDRVVAECCDVLARYRLRTLTGDRYAGEWVASRFKAHGVKYLPSEKSKRDLYIEFLPLLNGARVELLDSSRLVEQIVNLERRTGVGKDLIDHPPNQHDDLANAVAGAAAGQVKRKIAGTWGTRSHERISTEVRHRAMKYKFKRDVNTKATIKTGNAPSTPWSSSSKIT